MSTDKKEYGISVIIPCYNVGQYVEETLKSVLNQSFKNYEIICLNDGSTDGTLEILNKYQSLYPYIQVFTGENHGVAYQRNKGVQRARGKYIYYLDGDDLIKENCLETLYQYAEADSLDILYFEDNLYTVRTMIKAARARCVRDNLYLRRVRGNSIMTGGKRKIRFESYLEVVRGLMQILEDEKQNSALQEAIYKRIRGTYINIFKDYLKVPESERDELFGEKNSPLYLLIGMAFFMNIEEVDRKKVSEKLKKTYAEKSEINAKLQRTYAEKSEINAKLKKTHEEKAERGEKIKKLQRRLKATKAELEKKTKRLEQLEQEKKQLEEHFLGRLVLGKYNK